MGKNRSEIIGFSGWKFDDPPKHNPIWFEIIDEEYWTTFFQTYSRLPYYTGGIYLMTIAILQNYMKNRKPFELKKILFAWNVVIGLFSIIGFIRTVPELFGIVTGQDGFFRSICTRDGLNKPLAFWILAFILSKYLELGDTIFIILRKRPLVLLQWYHHVITLIATWTAGMYVEPIGRWYAVLNYGVHALMYPYFALRVVNVRLPPFVACTITTLQFTQMIVGLFVNFYSVHLMNSGMDCDRHPNSIKLFSLIYGSFTILFGNLFYDSVVTRYLRYRRKLE